MSDSHALTTISELNEMATDLSSITSRYIEREGVVVKNYKTGDMCKFSNPRYIGDDNNVV